MHTLHQAPIPNQNKLPHIKDWLSRLLHEHDIPVEILAKARRLSSKLLQTSGPDVLLHGDLHHDNILKNGPNWMAIDPKGLIGEASFEVGAFIRNPIPDLLSQINPQALIHNRINLFAQFLNAPKSRIYAWCYVQSVLAWIWALEDGGDFYYWEQLTKLLEQSDLNDFLEVR